MKAKDILDAKGREVVTLPTGATLDQAIALLAERNIGAVLVMEGDKPAGILSERDVVRSLAGAPKGFRETKVDQLMTRQLRTAGPGASVDELLDLMTERRIRHLPIMEGERLEGLVSIGDVVKHRMREVVGEREALQAYIAGGG
jgi:CBS domain-containing protein